MTWRGSSRVLSSSLLEAGEFLFSSSRGGRTPATMRPVAFARSLRVMSNFCGPPSMMHDVSSKFAQSKHSMDKSTLHSTRIFGIFFTIASLTQFYMPANCMEQESFPVPANEPARMMSEYEAGNMDVLIISRLAKRTANPNANTIADPTHPLLAPFTPKKSDANPEPVPNPALARDVDSSTGLLTSFLAYNELETWYDFKSWVNAVSREFVEKHFSEFCSTKRAGKTSGGARAIATLSQMADHAKIPKPNQAQSSNSALNPPPPDPATQGGGPRAQLAQSSPASLLQEIMGARREMEADQITTASAIQHIGTQQGALVIPGSVSRTFNVPTQPDFHPTPSRCPPWMAISVAIQKQGEENWINLTFPSGNDPIPQCCVFPAHLASLKQDPRNSGKYSESWLPFHPTFFFDAIHAYLYIFTYIWNVKATPSSGHAFFSPTTVDKYCTILHEVFCQINCHRAAEYDRLVRTQIYDMGDQYLRSNSKIIDGLTFFQYIESKMTRMNESFLSRLIIKETQHIGSLPGGGPGNEYRNIMSASPHPTSRRPTPRTSPYGNPPHQRPPPSQSHLQGKGKGKQPQGQGKGPHQYPNLSWQTTVAKGKNPFPRPRPPNDVRRAPPVNPHSFPFIKNENKGKS